MKPIVSQAGLRRWLAPPDLREQGAIWALALLGFAVSSIGYEHARATMPSLGFDCARPRSVRVERGFTRGVACTPPPGGGRPLQGPARWLFGQRVSLGDAGPRLLEALPSIGPARAQAILEARHASRFDSVDDLDRVHGIGPATIEKLRPFLRIEPPSRVDPSTGPRLAPDFEPSLVPALTQGSAKTDGEG